MCYFFNNSVLRTCIFHLWLSNFVWFYRFGITFLVHGEENSKSRECLGRSICFHTKEELYTWLSSINYFQTQDGTLNSSNTLQHSSQAMSRSTSALPVKVGFITTSIIRYSIKKIVWSIKISLCIVCLIQKVFLNKCNITIC